MLQELIMIPALMSVMTVLMCLGCKGNTNIVQQYDQAIASGMKMREVQDWNRLFPNSSHFITHYTQQAGQPIWNSEAGLYGRYIFAMQIEITISGANDLAKRQDSKVLWSLVEVSDVQFTADGRVQTEFSNQWYLTEAQWRKLVAQNGDFSAVGIDLQKQKPVRDFDRTLTPR